MRVAFSPVADSTWTGGMHYLKNLLQALSHSGQGTIEPVLICSTTAPDATLEMLRDNVKEIIRDSSFTLWSPAWSVRQISRRLLDRDMSTERLLNRYHVDAVFHAGLFGMRFGLPCVNWIADFQHRHMPEMFSRKERQFRDQLFRDLARMSQVTMVSSNCSKQDFEEALPEYRDRVAVASFVSQIPSSVYATDPLDRLRGYDLPEKFFHLPNQFWKHKNHAVVIDALKLLRDRRSDISVVCTGKELDRRNPAHVESLKQSIVSSGLKDTIHFLGLIPLDHLYALMRQSVAVINPSFFEGWSTTVEEAHSLGKQVLLSDIPVHREQAPPAATYFDPNDPSDLADKMLALWGATQAGPDHALEAVAKASADSRISSFARSFEGIMERALMLKGGS